MTDTPPEPSDDVKAAEDLANLLAARQDIHEAIRDGSFRDKYESPAAMADAMAACAVTDLERQFAEQVRSQAGHPDHDDPNTWPTPVEPF